MPPAPTAGWTPAAPRTEPWHPPTPASSTMSPGKAVNGGKSLRKAAQCFHPREHSKDGSQARVVTLYPRSDPPRSSPAAQPPTVSAGSTSSSGSSGGPSPRGWGLGAAGGACSRAPSSPVTRSRTMPEFCMAWCSRFSRPPSPEQGSSSEPGGCGQADGGQLVRQRHSVPTCTHYTEQSQGAPGALCLRLGGPTARSTSPPAPCPSPLPALWHAIGLPSPLQPH